MHSLDVGWRGRLQLNRPTPYGQYWLERRRTKSRKSGAVQLCCKYVVTFPEEGDPRPTGIPSPGSAPLSHLSASINAVLSMHPTPRPIPICSQFRIFLHMPSVLKMYWVVLTADCRNSVCRNRVRRNSVCLPSTTIQDRINSTLI